MATPTRWDVVPWSWLAPGGEPPWSVVVPPGEEHQLAIWVHYGMSVDREERRKHGRPPAEISAQMSAFLGDLARTGNTAGAASGTLAGSLSASAQARMIGVPAAARELGISEGLVRRWARDDRIPGAVKAGRDWALPADAIADLRRSRDSKAGGTRH